jgi:uncharacterized protein YutE (UPF0331/DUF86 family)
VVLHEYAILDLDRAVEAMDRLEPLSRFVQLVARIEAG